VQRFTDHRAHHIIDSGDGEVDPTGCGTDVQQNLIYVGWRDMFEYVGAEAVVELLTYWSREVVLEKSKSLSEMLSDFGVEAIGCKIESNHGKVVEERKVESASSSSCSEVTHS